MDDQLPPAIKSEVAGPSIKDIFFKYLRFLPLFIISVALSLLVAYLYLRYTTEIYSSTGALVIKDEKNSKQGGDPKFNELFSGGVKNIQSEIEYIRSRPLMERVVKSLNLNFAYEAKGRFKNLNLYDISPFHIEAVRLNDSIMPFALNIKFENEKTFSINNEKGLYALGQNFSTPHGIFRLVRNQQSTFSDEYNVTWQSTTSRAINLTNDLLVAPKTQGTGIITILLESTSPILAADVVNKLMEEYQVATIEDKNITTRQTIDFIDGRLRIVSRELDSITNNLLAYQKLNKLINPEAQSAEYLAKLSETDKLLNDQKIQIDIAQNIGAYLGSQGNAFNVVPSSLGIQDATLNTLIAGYNVTQLERKALIDGNVPRGNIAVQQKEDLLEKLRRSILENLRNLRSAYGSSINQLRQQNSYVQDQIRTLPEKQQNFIEIQRQQQGKQEMYNFLMARREESAISLAATISDTKVLEKAAPEYAPVKPKRRSVQLIAFAIGLLLPALVIFILEVLNDKVTSKQDVERLTSATILGEVGHSFANNTLIVTTNSRSVVAEQFRIIRSNLQYIVHNIKKPVILVTSTFSGEGKSFISTNIGSVMALAGKRTIILEFDIRKPKILTHLGMTKKPGLTNYLLGKVTLQDLPVSVPEQENLFVLPCGPVPPNPAEMLLDEKLADLFVYLRQNFDVIIMDTAPAGMVSDAITLSKYADCT
ncbi:MAG: polysaccharide biosynthesis tyrosine autokinase, partial [Chitinophagaceae bacterium]